MSVTYFCSTFSLFYSITHNDLRIINNKYDFFSELSNGTEIVSRMCAIMNPPPFMSLVDNANCVVCNKDLCNNANVATVSMAALGCLLSFWAIRFVLTNS